MILRRFMKHVTDQNWFAVGLDVIVVIVGIFLGLQVTEWNDRRVERALEVDYLARLHDDISKSVIVNERVITNRIIENNRLLHAIENLQKCQLDQTDKDDFASAMYKLSKYTPPFLADSVFEELSSTGKFQTLQNIELRSAVSELYSSMVRRERTDSKMTDRLTPHVVFVERFFTYNIDQNNTGVSDITWDQMTINFEQICKNNEIHRALSVINTYMIIVSNQSKEAVKEQRSILMQIDAEMDALK